MKRSEMIKLMNDTYIKFDTKMSTTRDKMSLILEEMEKVGILPPCRDADVKSEYGYARIWKWSKEDETK